MNDETDAAAHTEPAIVIWSERMNHRVLSERMLAELDKMGLAVVVVAGPAPIPTLPLSRLNEFSLEPLERLPDNPEQNYLKLRKRWS